MLSIRHLASQKIQSLGDLLEENSFNLEIEYQPEELLITDTSHRHFLLNYHGVTQQLWYSSALTGAHHFQLTGNQQDWVCTRTGQSFNTILSQELSQILGQEIILTDTGLHYA